MGIKYKKGKEQAEYKKTGFLLLNFPKNSLLMPEITY
jgi:hypothetical protein